ncbi:MAG: kgd, partial [Glaciihabitans sp.]|nr:kgd [Glaciihabitans sp.]
MSSQVTGIEDGASGEFGANEWLVDEMYERYIVDKNSVDQSWWPILESYKPTAVDPAPTTAAPIEDSTAAAPESQIGGEAQMPAEITPDIVAENAPQPEVSPISTPSTPSTQTGAQPVARTTSVQAKPAPIPAEAPSTSAIPVIPAPGGESPAEAENIVSALKGVAKTIAANMDASLSVPTATSVRTIPAKLMIDNRIVINNHLKR